MRVEGSGFRVQGSGFRVQGRGLRVEGRPKADRVPVPHRPHLQAGPSHHGHHPHGVRRIGGEREPLEVEAAVLRRKHGVTVVDVCEQSRDVERHGRIALLQLEAGGPEVHGGVSARRAQHAGGEAMADGGGGEGQAARVLAAHGEGEGDARAVVVGKARDLVKS